MDTAHDRALELAKPNPLFSYSLKLAVCVFPIWVAVLLLPGLDVVARGLFVGGILLATASAWLTGRPIHPADKVGIAEKRRYAELCSGLLARHYGPGIALLTSSEYVIDAPEEEPKARAGSEIGARLRRESDYRSR